MQCTARMNAPVVDCVTPQQDGAWDDVSGETFLRTLLSMPTQGAKFDVVSSLLSPLTPNDRVAELVD